MGQPFVIEYKRRSFASTRGEPSVSRTTLQVHPRAMASGVSGNGRMSRRTVFAGAGSSSLWSLPMVRLYGAGENEARVMACGLARWPCSRYAGPAQIGRKRPLSNVPPIQFQIVFVSPNGEEELGPLIVPKGDQTPPKFDEDNWDCDRCADELRRLIRREDGRELQRRDPAAGEGRFVARPANGSV
jgi:hypothetical protein